VNNNAAKEEREEDMEITHDEYIHNSLEDVAQINNYKKSLNFMESTY